MSSKDSFRSLKCLTQPSLERSLILSPTFSSSKSPKKAKLDPQRQLNKSQQFRGSPYVHNRTKLPTIKGTIKFKEYPQSPVSLNLGRDVLDPRLVNSAQVAQPFKPFFKLPKLETQPLNDIEMDSIGKKVVKLKKSMRDPFGCSKSSILEKVRLKRKIMGEGPMNRLVYEQFNLKVNSQKKSKSVNRRGGRAISEYDQQRYKMKVYGDFQN